ncbi:TlpA family protein disulfide reductase [Olivibacter domesticus]|uniref:Thiol-disulfide isomerase or thioredoxin n=1 Tax=Olivibacter domesticus TaxID=407022 RepID=A0A1H7JR20_OLID1|nr:TlpA disulfide reductase family protein [Olivibacter domesticus]SEK75905.1 Thiol-disulfide isomerase or thioredoxin [Olivibacter domesticus]
MKLFTSYIRELFVQFLKLESNSKSEELSRSEALRSIVPVQRSLHKGEMTRGKSLASYVLSLATIKILFCVCLAHAGQRGLGNPAAAGVALSTDSIKPLQIGDSIPSALWNLPLQMIKSGQEGSTTVSLNDYRNKLIILDFWATWCGPCVASMPKLDSLQHMFPNKLMVLPSSLENESKVLPFLSQKSIQLPSIIKGTVLDKWFPHRTIPHQIWIKEGRVMNITRASSATAENINTILTEGEVRLLQKKDGIAVTENKVEDKGIYQSKLTYRSSLHKSGMLVDSNKLAVYNVPVTYLFVEAYAEEIPFYGRKNRVFIETDELTKSKVQPYKMELTGNYTEDSLALASLKSNTYCYTLEFEKGMERSKMQYLMRGDLNNMLGLLMGIEARVEERMVKCFILKIKKDISSLISKGGKPSLTYNNGHYNLVNKPLSTLIESINSANWQQPLPIISGIPDDVSIDIKLKSRLKDLTAVKMELQTLGLYLEEEMRSMTVLVIKNIKSI